VIAFIPANDVLVIHSFGRRSEAETFLSSAELREAMQRAGWRAHARTMFDRVKARLAAGVSGARVLEQRRGCRSALGEDERDGG
jgi:hypothetical protein